MIYFKEQSKLYFRLYESSCSYFRHISNVRKKITNSYYFMNGDVLLSSSTLGQLVDEAADDSGDHVAFVSAHQGISRTFSEFRNEVNKLASGLISLGLRKGDTVAICSPNCAEWPVVQYAAAKAGLLLANINPAYQAHELEYCLKKIRCKSLITWDVLKTQDFYQILCKVVPELPRSAPTNIQSQNIPSLKSVIMITNDAKNKSGVLTYDEALNAGNSESDAVLHKVEKSLQFDDPINIQFTSGTTGKPKGAVLSHHNVINNALVSGRRLGYHLAEPVVCCPVPLFHCFGCVLGTIGSVIFRNTCVFPYAGFDAASNLAAIEKYKCTVIYGTPTMYVDVLNTYSTFKPNIDSLKQAVIGGAASTENLVKDVRNKLGVSCINIAYGSTENSPAVAVNGFDDGFEHAVKQILQPLEFVELKVTDDKGALVPVNTQGELCARGHVLFMGYFEEEDKTAEVVDATNWYHTGDLCVMNEYGYVHINGRKKDMIIRGGENLYPVEIENFIATHPAVLEVQVVGVPDDRMGEEACAWISVIDGQHLTESEVKSFCKGKISHFKIPRYILFVDDFPKTVSGKIKKFEMKRISIEKLNLG